MLECSKIDSCKLCSISELSFNVKNLEKGCGKLYGWGGGEKIKYFFVGLNPSYNRFPNLEYAFGGDDFDKGTGKTFVEMLKKTGIFPWSYVTNLVKCSTKTNSVDSVQMSNCFPFLKEEIDMVNPDVVIAMGAQVYHFLSLQNIGISVEKIWHPNFCISYHPEKTNEYIDTIRKICQKK